MQATPTRRSMPTMARRFGASRQRSQRFLPLHLSEAVF
jgi:hypothetical protein